MTLTRYKSYSIITVGLSRHIYRPGTEIDLDCEYLPTGVAYAQSMAEAKRWINADISNREG